MRVAWWCTGCWAPAVVVESAVEDRQARIGADVRVIVGVRGGVGSTVAAELLSRAIGDRLHGIVVDNGLLRKNEFEQVLEDYKDMGLNVRGVRAGDQFLEARAGESDPEIKRKATGRSSHIQTIGGGHATKLPISQVHVARSRAQSDGLGYFRSMHAEGESARRQ